MNIITPSKSESNNLVLGHSKSMVSEVEIVYKNKVAATNRVKVKSAKDAEEIFRNAIGDKIETNEYMYAMYLNNANHVLGVSLESKGGMTGTVADVCNICVTGLKLRAKAVILCHNHPSGTLKASEADKGLTKSVKDGLRTIDIKLLDHLIITSESYLSFADDCLM